MTQTPEQIHAAAIEWLRDGHCPEELKLANGALNQQDADLIGKYIESHHDGVWSVLTLNQTVSVLSSRLHYRSKAEVAYDTAYSKITPEQRNAFGVWWQKSAKQYIQTENQEGFENAAKILSWCVGKSFTPDLFDRAVSNLFSTSGLRPSAPREQGERRGHIDDGKPFMPKEQRSKYRADGKINHAFQDPNQKKSEPVREAPSAWDRVIEQQLADGTHSQQATSKELYQKLLAEGLSPRQISSKLSEHQRSYKRQFLPTAV